MELPRKKVGSETTDPVNLIIYSKPKMGKTTALSALENNLIIDTEDGSRYVDALKVSVNNAKDINELCKALEEAGNPYDFLTIDTMTSLEEICKPIALKLYQATAAGKNYTGDILSAPNGSGYGHLRTAIEKVQERLKKHTRNLILVCHSKDAAIDSDQVTVKQIDLLGKTGRILASKADAMGFLTRDENSNTILSFNTNNSSIECGARPAHLRNADIVLGEMQPDGTIEFHWERVFPSLNKKVKQVENQKQ